MNINELRNQALEILQNKDQKVSQAFTDKNLKTILHELDVYAEELRVQNATLIDANHTL